MNNKRFYKKILAFILCFTVFASSIVGVVMADNYEIINDAIANPIIHSSVYANNTYIAVGEGGSIYTSTDSTNWFKQEVVTNSDLHDIVYGNHEFVAVGSNGTVITSENGINWFVRATPVTSDLNSIIYYNNQYIVVGDNGVVIVSLSTNNLWNWTQQTINNINNTNINDIIRAKGVYIVVGDNGIIASSGNLSSWTILTSNTTENLYAIATNEGKEVLSSDKVIIGGDNGALLTSYNGESWTVETSPTTGSAIMDIVYANNLFVLVGVSSVIMTSTNGTNWSSKPSDICDWYNVSYLNNLYFCFGLNCMSMYSADAASWSGRTIGGFAKLNDVIYINNQFIAVGNSGTIVVSDNGVDWIKRSMGQNYTINSIAYGLNRYIAVCNDGKILSSSDSITWALTSKGSENINDVCFTNGKFVAVGENGTIISSKDGNNWSLEESPTTYDLNAVYGYGSDFVAVGDIGTIVYSTDDIAWSVIENSRTNLYDVAYVDGKYIAVGAGGTIKYSSDLANWTSATVETNKTLTSICPEKRIVISNSGEIYGSSNLTSWDIVLVANTDLNGVVYGLNKYIAVGEDIVSFIADVTAPVVTASEQGNYTKGDVTVTVSIDDESEIVLKKWASGTQNAAYFSENGTDFTGNTFKVSENGSYTIYAKDKGNLEATKQITVTKHDSVSPTPPEWVQHYGFSGTQTRIMWDYGNDNGVIDHYLIYKNNALLDTVNAGTRLYIDNATFNSTDTYSIIVVDEAGNQSTPTNSIYQNGVLLDGFYPGISVSTVKNNITLLTDETVEITNADGIALSDTDYIGSNTHIIIKKDGATIEEYIVVLYGDIDGNGLINSADITAIRKLLFGVPVDARNIEHLIADINYDSYLNLLDFVRIKKVVSDPSTFVCQNRLGHMPSRLGSITDFEAPTVTATSSTAWGSSNTITVNATDSKSGVVYKAWKSQNSTSYTYFTTNTFDVFKNGKYDILVRDACGNETVKIVIVNHIIDGKQYGGYEQSFEDLFVETKGEDIHFNRYYSSLNNESGIFGQGWLSTYEMSCKDYNNDPELNLKIVTIPGENSYLFALDNGIYTSGMTRMTLTAKVNGTFELATTDDIIYTFNSNGYLISINDIFNNLITIDVNKNAKIQKITDSVGREYTYNYKNDLLYSITDPASRAVRYEYTDNRMLRKVVNPLGTSRNLYTYDENMNLTAITDMFDNVIQKIEYDNSSDMVSKIIDANNNEFLYSYDKNNLSVTITDAAGDDIVYTYNAFGQMVSEVMPSGMVETTYCNSLGEIASVTKKDSNGLVQDITNYTYDSYGNVLVIKYTTYNYQTSEDGETSTTTNITTEEYTYDSKGNVLSQKDVEGKRKYYEYDEFGNVVTEITPLDGTTVYDPSTSDESDFTFVEHQYNDDDSVASEYGLVYRTRKDGATITYYYDDYGYLYRIRHSKDGSTYYEYDIIGWLSEISTPDGIEMSYRYNLNGDTIRINKNNVTQIRTVYDSYGRIKQQIEGAEYILAYDGLEMSPSMDTYHNNWNEVEVGTRYYYNQSQKAEYVKMSCYTVYLDDKQNVTSVKVNNTNNLVTYNYNSDAHNLLDSVDYGNDQSIIYTYTDAGKISSIKFDDNSSPAYTYEYDESGELISKVDVINNIRTNFEGEIITVYRINEDKSLTQTHKYKTENIEDVQQFVETVGENVYTVQRLSNSDKYFLDEVNSIYMEKTFAYDEEENLIGTTIKKSNNSNSSLATSSTYDASGKISSYQNSYGINSESYTYSYDSDGNISTIGYDANTNDNLAGITTRYIYDIAGQLTRIDDAATNRTVVYEYNGFTGNVTAIKEYPYTVGSTLPVTPSSTREFVYGDASWTDKLTSVDGNIITYDAVGNPLTYNGWNYTWEAGRQLKKMTNSSNTFNYNYDDNGIRISKTINGVTTNYTTVDGRITSQSNEDNDIYFRYDRNYSLVGFNLDGIEYLYMKNATGEIVGILDINGNLVVTYTYDAWGKVLTVSGTLAGTVGTINPMRYRDYYLDFETGYYYLQSRYYNPDICRFINVDEPNILSLNFGNVVAANLFVYCKNNPIMFSDISGLWAQNYSGFIRTSKGFNLNVHLNFLSRTFCVAYAADIIRLYGQWYWWGKGYKNMNSIRIAQELWFHAIVYYIGAPTKAALSKFGISWSWLNSKVKSAKYMEINNDDSRAWVFSMVWWSAYAFKSYIRWCRGCGYPYSFIHI